MRLLIVIVALALVGTAEGAKKKQADDSYDPGQTRDDMEAASRARRKAHASEMKKLDATPDEKIDDWTLHTDYADNSKYWFSRMFKRSRKEPPKGWTLDPKKGWRAPPRKRDEL